MIEPASPQLWDSFWADHASSQSLFHRLLWRIRFLFSQAYARHIVRAMRFQPGAQLRLIEVGCGSARTLHYLLEAQPTSQCLALDLSPSALGVVRRLSPTFHPVVSDAFRLPLNDHCAQVTFSIGLIEHFERDLAAHIVSEHARVTASGGLVVVMVPWKSSFYNLVRYVFGKHWPFGRELPFRRQELRDFMRAQNLREIEIHVIYGSTLLAIGHKPLP